MIDVDIRHGTANWPSYEVRTVQNETFAVLASPKLLAQCPILRAPDLLDRDPGAFRSHPAQMAAMVRTAWPGFWTWAR